MTEAITKQNNFQSLENNNSAKAQVRESEKLESDQIDHVFNTEADLSEKTEEQISDLHKNNIVKNTEQKIENKEDSSKTYIEQFLANKLVRNVIPDVFNWVNIAGNGLSALAIIFKAENNQKNRAKKIGDAATKSFMIANGAINFIERMNFGNKLSALGYLADVLIPAFKVDQDHTYLARGFASGSYNLANALHLSDGNPDIRKLGNYAKHLSRAVPKFVKNLFSKDIISNIQDSRNAMWAPIGGLFSWAGALSWVFSGKDKLPTLLRDIGGVVMDIEQVNPGHLKNGNTHFFWSGISLMVGTIADFVGKFVPAFKELSVPLTFLFDGVGRTLLRVHQNKVEDKSGSLAT